MARWHPACHTYTQTQETFLTPMPIQHAIWKVGTQPTPLSFGKLASEQALEDMIVREPSILSPEWMLIGRQEQTGLGGRIDLLAVAPDGSLVLIELKRNRTPREIVAQGLDYAAWVEKLTADRIAQIYQRFSNGGSLDDAFQKRFGTKLDEETLNEAHQVVLVAAELDDATERIIQYLNDRDIAINVLFFRVFQHGADLLLSRAWLIDPGQTQANVATTTKRSGEKEPWNGEYYVSFGTGEGRTWEDARKYGFISAGGGSWYTQTLKLLSPGDRAHLGDRVGRVVPVPARVQRRRRREREHVRPASGARRGREVRKTGARARPGPAHVHRHHQVEALERRVRRAREADRAGVVDQDVDAAEVFDRRGHRAIDRRLVADVAGECECATTGRLDLAGRGVDRPGELRMRPIALRDDGDVRAVARRRQRDREPYAARGRSRWRC